MNIKDLSKAIDAENEALGVPIQYDNEPLTFTGSDGQEQPVEIGVYGPNSRQNRAAKRWAGQQYAALGRKATEAEQDEIGAGLLARCCGWWRGIVDANGALLEFSVDAATEYFLAFPLIADQVDAAAGNAGRYRSTISER